jgi:hypothetical protein
MPKLPPVACFTCGRSECNCKPIPVAVGQQSDSSEHDRLMRTSRWKNKVSPLCRSFNPLCQRLKWNGTRWAQCRYPSKEVHHIDANIRLFWAPANLVALCGDCHHKGQGDSGVCEQRFYVPTKWILGGVHPHPLPPPGKGEVVIGPDGFAVVGR